VRRHIKYLARGSYGCILQDLDAAQPTAVKLYYGEKPFAHSNAVTEQITGQTVRSLDREGAFSIVPLPLEDQYVDDLHPSQELDLCNFRKPQPLGHPVVPSAYMELAGEAMGSFRGVECVPSSTTVAMTLQEFTGALRPLMQGLVRFAGARFSHNDIRPDNIVHTAGGFKFIDFGLAGNLPSFLSLYEQYGSFDFPFYSPEVACRRADGDCESQIRRRLAWLYSSTLQALVTPVAVFHPRSSEFALWSDVALWFVPQSDAAKAQLPDALAQRLRDGPAPPDEDLMSLADVFALGASILYMLRAMAAAWIPQGPELFKHLLQLAAGMAAVVVGGPLFVHDQLLLDRHSAESALRAYDKLSLL
jgi:serine/threonine protein kinase